MNIYKNVDIHGNADKNNDKINLRKCVYKV